MPVAADDKQSQGVILALGSINADFQLRVERRPQISETLTGRDFARFGGGKAANVAFFARHLGAEVRLFGCVGDDDLAEQALKPLRKKGVDLSTVHRVPGDTGVAMITVPPDGNKGIVLAANANHCWDESMIGQLEENFAAAPDGSILVVDCEVPAEVVARAVAAARERDFPVILDPSPADQVSQELLCHASVITPNASEARQILDALREGQSGSRELEGPDAARQAGQDLRQLGVDAACMKLPEGGCVLVSDEGSWHVGSFSVEVVDTTGAGDAFAGALAVALLKGMSLPDASCRAVAASHLSISGYGSQTALPDADQLEQATRRLSLAPL
ncbi:ribokinase [Proteobacteria bacterium 005FR1]|nr:ribokinase [Proteobacteria bacterium 005FR1]